MAFAARQTGCNRHSPAQRRSAAYPCQGCEVRDGARNYQSESRKPSRSHYDGRIQYLPGALAQLDHTDKHNTINHSREYAHGDVHTNTVESAFSLLKRGIVGSWHKVDAKHLPAYLDEMCFRFNNRKNPYLFRDTIIKLIQTPNLEYRELTARVQDVA